MSPCYQRAAMALHFTWKPEWKAVKALLPQIEEKLKPFDARPHWAKLFSISPAQIQSCYTKLSSFKDLLNTNDPAGKFRNGFIDTNLFSS